MSIIYLYYNARMYGGGLKEMPCFRTHIKLVAMDMLYQAMLYVSLQRLLMAIEMACN